MKIVHVCSAPAKPDGIKGVLKKMFPSQMEAGHSVRVFSLRGAVSEFEHVDTARKFYDRIKDDRPDIVIFHSVYYLPYLMFAAILFFLRIPYAVQLHGALSHENYKISHRRKQIANLLAYKRFIKGAKGIIYLNENEYRNSVVETINPRYVIIPNGCDVVETPEIDGLLSENYVKFIYISRIHKHTKGLDLLIDAIEQISKTDLREKVRFDFYGDGRVNECEWFKEQLPRISGLARFHGPVYGDQKDKALRNADIFILTSRSEGMPMAVLESLSYGLPCVLTAQTNLGEEVNDAAAGWLTGLSVEEIVKTIELAVIQYTANPRSFRENAVHLSEKYSWNKIAHDSTMSYQQLLNVK